MRILFLDATRGFYPDRLKEKPTGGILTSLTLIPRYLARHGWDVHVLSAWEQTEKVEGVQYIQRPIERNVYDVVVLNRNMLDRNVVSFFKDSLRVWWLHDIADHRYLEDDAFRRVDKVVALSDYCKRSYSDFYGIPMEKFVVIPNGVDKDTFYPDYSDRNPDLYICASAPIKGFYPLAFAFENMRRLSPTFEIRTYCSQKLHELDNLPGMDQGLENLRQAGITVLDPIPQPELAKLMRKAWALLMPNHYPEICSNVLLQAQASGLPVIASNIGSAAEFITHEKNGLLTKTGPQDWYWWWKDFAEQCARLHIDKRLHAKLSAAAANGVPSWDDIGARWLAMLERSCKGVLVR